jgi:hypothetical protein
MSRSGLSSQKRVWLTDVAEASPVEQPDAINGMTVRPKPDTTADATVRPDPTGETCGILMVCL